ncbi:MAG: hypothetical protein HC862_18310 [Scytonema sp. RU_4_4]|nr:hypothetical protein [Scytonema sp. RU_4_4]
MLRNVKTPQILTNERQNKREGKRQMLYLGRPQDRTGSPPAVLAPNDQ